MLKAEPKKVDFALAFSFELLFFLLN